MTEDTPVTPPRQTSAAEVTLIFAFVGPIVGSVVGYAVMLLEGNDFPNIDASGVLQLFPFVLMFGYICGLVPAILTALAVIWWPKNHALQSPAARGSLAGGVFSGLTAAVLFWSETDRDYNPVLWTCLAAFMGAAAGLVCGWFSHHAVPRYEPTS